MADAWEDVHRAGDWLLDVAAESGADVIHLNGYVHAALPWDRPLLVVGHSCVLSWWQAVKGQAAPSEWRRYRDAVERGLEAADMVVTPSDSMLLALRRHYRFSCGSRVVPTAATLMISLLVRNPT
jgi:hypothetical protein